MDFAKYNGKEINGDQGVDIRNKLPRNNPPMFACVECGQRARVMKAGGHMDAHFEHFRRNPDCTLSHVDKKNK